MQLTKKSGKINIKKMNTLSIKNGAIHLKTTKARPATKTKMKKNLIHLQKK